MRGFTAYMLGGALAVLAMDAFAPSVGFNMAIGAWPAVPPVASATQEVNRGLKGDRLDMPPNTMSRQPTAPVALPDGCELAYSPLSASADASAFAQRCFAELVSARQVA